MSENSVVLSTNNQLFVNTDLSKIFLWNNRYETDNYINNSYYEPITLNAGTVMGRIATTGVLIPCQAGAADGSQYPIGILARDLVIDIGETVQAPICVAGDVAEEMILFFNGAATGMSLDYVVSDRRMRDRLAADTVGIKIVPCVDLTGYDNQ